MVPRPPALRPGHVPGRPALVSSAGKLRCGVCPRPTLLPSGNEAAVPEESTLFLGAPTGRNLLLRSEQSPGLCPGCPGIRLLHPRMNSALKLLGGGKGGESLLHGKVSSCAGTLHRKDPRCWVSVPSRPHYRPRRARHPVPQTDGRAAARTGPAPHTAHEQRSWRQPDHGAWPRRHHPAEAAAPGTGSSGTHRGRRAQRGSLAGH